MKILAPFNPSDIGGTSCFALKFKQGLEEKGHQVYFDYVDDYDILFVIVQCDWHYLIDAKKRNKPIVHRLDGIHYWALDGPIYFLKNLKPKIIHLFLSDFTIYQSNYSKYCVEKFLGNRKDDAWAIIYNGTDLDIFSPLGKKQEALRDNPTQKLFFAASRFRHEEQIIPLIESAKIYFDNYDKNFKLIIAGSFSGPVQNIPQKYSHFPYLEFIGKIKNNELPVYERAVDVFFYFHPNSACPNNIIEAMACGLPICGADDGAMKELVQINKNGELVETKHDAFWLKRKYDPIQIAKNIDTTTKKLSEYKINSRKIAEERFSLDRMLNQYLEAFDKSLALKYKKH